MIYFDIETLGISPYTSPVVSIGYSHQGKLHGLYASPPPGTRMYSWAEKNVWNRIRGRPSLSSEREIIEKFIKLLQSSPFTPVAGWNIGTIASIEQQGFDIPFLLVRAKKYGLYEELLKALQGRQIRDIGREYSVKLVKEFFSKMSEEEIKEIDEPIWRSFDKYRKAIEDFELDYIKRTGKKPTLTATAQALAGMRRFQLTGWKQEQLHQLLGLGKYSAHEAMLDVEAMANIPLPENVSFTKEQLKEWYKMSLHSSLVGQLKSGGRTPFHELHQRAIRSGIEEEFLSSVFSLAKERGISVKELQAGAKLPKETWKLVQKSGAVISTTGETVADVINRETLFEYRAILAQKGVKVAGILAATAVAGMVISSATTDKDTYQPGRARKRKLKDDEIKRIRHNLEVINVSKGNIIPGQDDYYNVIEGLREEGISSLLRKQFTDFGSGYRRRPLPMSLAGQTIFPSILEFRRGIWDIPEQRAALEAELQRKQEEQHKTVGEFNWNELSHIWATSFYESLNQKAKDLRVVNLNRFEVEVEDADTLVLHRKDNKTSPPIYIRLAGIDAPEVGSHINDPADIVRIWQEQPGGQVATERLKSILFDNPNAKLVISTGRKTYGRYLGVVYTAEGQNINLQLLREGMVTALPFGPEEWDIMSRRDAAQAEQEAYQDRRGIWKFKRWQAYKIAAEAIGRPLTHNTATRIDKMAANLYFGAYATMLHDYQQETGELTKEEIDRARRIGWKLRKTHGPNSARRQKTIPIAPTVANDDAYNTIQGLGHKGIAWRIRRILTDFGSGWTGLFKIPQELLEALGAEKKFRAFSIDIDLIGREIGESHSLEAIRKLIETGKKQQAAGKISSIVASALTFRGDLPASEAAFLLKENLTEPQAQALKSLSEEVVDYLERNKTVRSLSFYDIEGIKQYAYAAYGNKPGSVFKALRRTIKHERFHEFIVNNPALKEAIEEKPSRLLHITGGGRLSKSLIARYMNVSSETYIPGSPKFGEEAVAFFIEGVTPWRQINRKGHLIHKIDAHLLDIAESFIQNKEFRRFIYEPTGNISEETSVILANRIRQSFHAIAKTPPAFAVKAAIENTVKKSTATAAPRELPTKGIGGGYGKQEGLGHKGIAWILRRIKTVFGSGAAEKLAEKGIFEVPKILEKFFGIRGVHISLPEAATSEKEIASAVKKSFFNIFRRTKKIHKLTEKEFIEAMPKIEPFISNIAQYAEKNDLRSVILMHKGNIEKAAKKLQNISSSKEAKRIIMRNTFYHETAHALIKEAGLTREISYLHGVISKEGAEYLLKRGYKKQTFLNEAIAHLYGWKAAGLNPQVNFGSDISEIVDILLSKKYVKRFAAAVEEKEKTVIARKARRKILATLLKNKEAKKIILEQRQKAAKAAASKVRAANLQKAAQRDLTKNALYGGKGHRMSAGKIVKLGDN